MATQNGDTDPNGIEHLKIPETSSKLSLATLGVHADDAIQSYTDVAPALHVSSTFRYPRNPDDLKTESEVDVNNVFPAGGPTKGDAHIYSRLTAPNSSRLELLLSEIIGGPVLTYSSGLSAFHALLTWLHPKVVAIGKGYHGCHGVLKVYQKLTGCKIVDLFDEKSWDEAGMGEGDVVHLETPVNPNGIAYNVEDFATKAHKRGARLTIDATFAPPPLLDPWKWGADFVMHSGTKYIGGHSDMLCGVIATGKHRQGWEKDYWGMFEERIYLGSVMGSMEGWLGVRSLRTFELRVKRQSENATRLVSFLQACLDGDAKATDLEDVDGAEAVRKVLARIDHASLQKDDMGWLSKQMPNGYGPVFAITTKTAASAKRLPSKLHLFHHATSLGGVESLIEWRSMSDPSVEPTLLRVSVGVEDFEDLKADFIQGFKALAKEGTV
ncbi:cystathionine gamma-synthase-like protein [Dothistroma septosporum NZE10]|uniref:Cystathionine gamma-synthase-like protein n=1 Tax=Dothistroma septosporum (strain NZE10 / CBS 128990) TaxID=675120 RepID=N1PTY2_DOTSN|nr:cystathionine gamma-synthase-like protein [Dothistroma septosporum NZE10]